MEGGWSNLVRMRPGAPNTDRPSKVRRASACLSRVAEPRLRVFGSMYTMASPPEAATLLMGAISSTRRPSRTSARFGSRPPVPTIITVTGRSGAD